MNELESKIIGTLKILGDYGLGKISISIDDNEKNVVIEDRINPIIKTTKINIDQFVNTDIKLLIQIVRSMRDGK